MGDFLTTRQVGEILGHPEWLIRRVVDSLDGIGRFGGKRMVPREKLAAILEAIRVRQAAQPQEAAT
jgi:hypothetical protein